MTRTCLLIAEQFEPTADVVLAELRRRDVPCVRWNLDRFPSDSSLTYRASNLDFAGEIASDGRKLDLDCVGSIWCRGFRPAGFPAGMSDPDKRFALAESQRALDALVTTMKALWVNHPHCTARANSKPAQLWMAREVGLEIPPTVFTNDPAKAQEFVRQSVGDTVYKAHSQSFEIDPGKVLYTGILTSEKLNKLDLIRVSPGIFQALVEKSHEVRTTVVGSRIFSAKIDSQANAETRIDWRHKPFDVEDEPIKLPVDLEEKILAMMQAFGLVFGAFDFIVTPEGRYIFLEVNPAGQYLWVEAETKLPITAALADVLGDACR